MTVFNETVTETLNIPHDAGLGLEFDDALVDGLKLSPQPSTSWAFLRTLSETLNVSQTDAGLWFALRSISEGLTFDNVLAANTIYGVTQTEIMQIADLMNVGYPVALVENMTLALLQQQEVAYLITEGLGLGDTASPTMKFGVALIETLRIADALYRFLDASITETVNMAMSLAATGSLRATLTENLSLSLSLTGTLLARAIVTETINLTQLDALRMIFAPIIEEGIQFDGMFVQPNGSYTTWAINAASGAVTEYTNYVFNSFAEMDGKYIAASSSGLYELLGDTDAGAAIIARIKGGMMNLGQSKYTSFKAAYIGMRDDGEHNDVYLRLVTGDDKTYTYKVQSKTMETTKVHFGKGLRARYFSYELYTVGQDFDLDAIEFIPIISSRRT
jgi:hypothetical protein